MEHEHEIENMLLTEMILKNKMMRMHVENTRLYVDNRALRRQYDVDQKKVAKLEKSRSMFADENQKFRMIIKAKNAEILSYKKEIKEFVIRSETAEMLKKKAERNAT